MGREGRGRAPAKTRQEDRTHRGLYGLRGVPGFEGSRRAGNPERGGVVDRHGAIESALFEGPAGADVGGSDCTITSNLGVRLSSAKEAANGMVKGGSGVRELSYVKAPMCRKG